METEGQQGFVVVINKLEAMGYQVITVGDRFGIEGCPEKVLFFTIRW